MKQGVRLGYRLVGGAPSAAIARRHHDAGLRLLILFVPGSKADQA